MGGIQGEYIKNLSPFASTAQNVVEPCIFYAFMLRVNQDDISVQLNFVRKKVRAIKKKYRPQLIRSRVK